MKTALLSAALAGAATAYIHVPGRLAPVIPSQLAAHMNQHERRQISGVRPDIVDELPEDCRDAAESFVSALPAEPSSFEEFSSSFYETATRTASETYLDCAWVTEMPDSAFTEFTDYADELVDWLKEDKNMKKVMDFAYECKEWVSSGGLDAAGDSPCQTEWDEFADAAVEGESPLFLLSIFLRPGAQRISPYGRWTCELTRGYHRDWVDP